MDWLADIASGQSIDLGRDRHDLLTVIDELLLQTAQFQSCHQHIARLSSSRGIPIEN